MQSMNRATLVGHVGREPERRKTQTDETVMNFNLATTERWKDKNGEQQERTEWHRVVAFGKLADLVAPMIDKGTPVLVEGQIRRREFVDAENKQRSVTEIVVSGFQGTINVLSPKPAETAEAAPAGG